MLSCALSAAAAVAAEPQRGPRVGPLALHVHLLPCKTIKVTPALTLLSKDSCAEPCMENGERPESSDSSSVKKNLELKRDALAAAGENEANVRYTLDAHPTLELVPHKPYIGGPGLTGPSECAGAPASEAAAAAARARRKGQLKGSGKGGGARRGGDGDGFSLSAASGAGGPSAAAAAAGSEQLRQAAGGRAASHAGTASTAAGGAGAGSVQALELAALAAAGCLVGRGLTRQEAALVQRFDPSGPRDTAGFFIAKFRKRK